MKKFRKNNKGFTLVELIIVVAIIAVLSAVAAPQYIKYVERSRQGVDAGTLEEVRHAVEIEAAVMESIDANTTVKIEKDGDIVGAGSFNKAGTDAQKANYQQIADIVGEKVDYKSKAAEDYDWIITVSTDGEVAWQNTASSGTPTGSVANIKLLQGGTLKEVTTTTTG